MKTTIYYSVMNCGDGSAYPKFFATEELAEFHQERCEEKSWGESCTGTLIIESCSPISVPEALDKEGWLKELAENIFDEDGNLLDYLDDDSYEVQLYNAVKTLAGMLNERDERTAALEAEVERDALAKALAEVRARIDAALGE